MFAIVREGGLTDPHDKILALVGDRRLTRNQKWTSESPELVRVFALRSEAEDALKALFKSPRKKVMPFDEVRRILLEQRRGHENNGNQHDKMIQLMYENRDED